MGLICEDMPQIPDESELGSKYSDDELEEEDG